MNLSNYSTTELEVILRFLKELTDGSDELILRVIGDIERKLEAK